MRENRRRAGGIRAGSLATWRPCVRPSGHRPSSHPDLRRYPLIPLLPSTPSPYGSYIYVAIKGIRIGASVRVGARHIGKRSYR